MRRHWEMSDVGKGFKIESYTIKDDPNILKKVSKNFFKNLSDISYVYNYHVNIDYELKPNNLKANKFESYDFDNEEEETIWGY